MSLIKVNTIQNANGTTALTIAANGQVTANASVTTLNAPSGVLATQNGMTGIAKAWVNFDGYTGTTATVKNSFNVSSVTYVSTAIYTIAFTTAMANANYVPLGTALAYTSTDPGITVNVNGSYIGSPSLMTTTQCQIVVAFPRLATIVNDTGIYIAFLGS